MKKDEFLKYLDDIGLTADFLGIYISDKPDYPPCDNGCCKDKDEWVSFSVDERGHVTIFDRSDEDECFNHMKLIVPDLLSDKGIKRVANSGAYALTKQELVEYLVSEYKMSEQKAEEQYEKLKERKNLLFEFKKYVKEGRFMDKKWALAPEGWTAERLCKEQRLSPLGAFNYMIYLYEEPDEALEHLKKGLHIRKLIDEPSKIKEVNILEQKEKTQP